MEEEYITIVEAARRVGMSDKTVRRAIHDGKLAACYPQPNKAEISITDLEAWHATLHVRPGETQDRLSALEARVSELTACVAILESQLAELSSAGPRKPIQPPPSELKLPEDHVWLSDFADQHYVPRNEAQRLYDIHMIHGQPISKSAKTRKYIAIGSKGRRDFWVQLHTRPDFRTCDGCPHEESRQNV
jgi:excisionase family DNA binding protein